ncbi:MULTISPECIES: LamG-like jellyroll fold domain-containing protein [unclassified Streptomyces]|uniref:LamG-like jellyroll fold domain-containing protein n=2 Tax=Streptomyces TaxID=1883 RepID=UPI002D787DB4|nr:LamG-like jellyroll fold domain-containing protein [Streptomyces sp. SM8]
MPLLALALAAPAGAAEGGAPRADRATAKGADAPQQPSSGEAGADDALARAKRTGEPVEVLTMRSESADVFAQPDGSLEAREYLRPVRTRVGDEWKSVDTELVRTTDGGVAPKAVTNRTVFSGGGDGPMVRLSKAGRELSFDWPGKLPEPTLSGDTATYADVLPDVDLRLTASADGYQSLVVVKTPEAAQDERLAKLRLGLDATGLDVSETEAGGLAATDAGSGGTVFEAATPVMWDSSEGPQEGSPSSRAATSEAPPERGEPGAGDSGRLAPVGVEVGSDGEELLLTPDAEVLKGEETVYPVFIDPQWYSPRASAWTMASKYWSGSPQWKFNGKKDEGLGYCGWDYCAPHDTKRLFYRIPVSKFAGKSILSAEFVVRNTWSASCDKRSVELWQTKDISSSTTWNSQNASGFWTKQLASESFAHGHTNCSAKDAEFNVKSAVQSAANAKNSTMTFGLRAGSESDKYGWKRFSDKAFLRVKYNRPPPQVKMSQLAMEYGGSCKKPTSAARVRTLGKIYANNITDPDGDPISVQFQAKWDAGDGKGLVARWSPARTTAKKSGSNFTVSLPSSIPVNKQIHWYVRSYDGAQYSPWSHAGDATGCYFVYDTSVPKAPSITSPEYPASDSENPEDAPYDGVGQYGSFTVKAADSDVVKYWYGVNMDPSSKNTLTTSKGAAQVAKVLPAEPGTHFFTAVAFDAAGNMSEPRTHLYRVKGGQPERATWQLDEAQGAGAGEGSTPDRLLTVHGEPEFGAEGAKGSAISLDGSDDYAQSDISVVDTDRGFTVSAWVKLSETPSGTATVAMQPGNNRPGFELYYSSAYERWIFNQYESDSQDAKIIRAMAPQAGGVKVGEWQHLVGSYNGSERFIELYVDGQQVGQADLPSAWNARRGLVLGAASHNGKVGNFLPGAIDEVQIFDKRITANEVAKLARHERVGDPGRPATAVFEMEDTADSVATAKGLRGHGGVLPADYHGGVTTGAEGVAGKAARFNGTDAYGKVGKISGPHVNTSRSFAVMAWAKMDKTKPSKAAIIAAQAGRERPGFELYYSQTYDRWAFNQYSADSADAKVIRAMQPDNQKAASDTWVHLAGVHDVVVGTLTLYVNGVKAGTTPLDGAFYADQSMFIGAGQYGSAVGNHFPGSIDDVRLFDRPVSAEEVQQVFKQRPVVKARWKFEETSGTAPVTTPDDTGSGNALTLGGDAAITSDDFYIDEGALVLNGATAHAVTNHAPVDSSASFTVATWVKASALTDKPLSLFQLEGTKTSAFGVRFLPDSRGADVGPGRWELTVTETDDAEAAHVSATHGNFSDAREWTHITVAYDGFNRSVRLYVDGLLDETVCQDDDGDGSADDSTCTETVPWAENALTFEAKSLSVGRPSASGTDQYFPGVIDDLWVFQSSLSERQVEQLAGSWFDVPTEVPQG